MFEIPATINKQCQYCGWPQTMRKGWAQYCCNGKLFCYFRWRSASDVIQRYLQAGHEPCDQTIPTMIICRTFKLNYHSQTSSLREIYIKHL